MSDWRHRAACRDESPDLFFPIGSTGPALLQIEDAKAVCRRCDVIDQCLQWALESGQDAGVWGGMSEDERRALKRKAARTRSYTPDLRARAVALYRDVRPEYDTDNAALKAVAATLGIDRIASVREWATDAGLIDPPPADTQRRKVLARVRDVRHLHRSDYATYATVAREYGLHPETIRQWVRTARAASKASAGSGA